MKKVKTIPYRRKRQGKTDYNRRLSLLKSKTLRLVVRKFNKNISAQLVEYSPEGDRILKSAHSLQLKDFGWKNNTGNIPAAYLTGYLLGTRAKGKQAILDIGLQPPKAGSRIFAVLKGASDAGLKVKFSEEIVPTEDRIKGNHISDKIKESFEKVKKSIENGKEKKK